MEMEVVMPIPATDFNFDSNCSSPYMTAPSSPQRFGNFFFSAPTSPSRLPSSLYVDLNNNHSSSSSTKLFNAEHNHNSHDDEDDDFEFNFSGQLEPTSLSADELFDGGKIRPLKPSSTNCESESRTSTDSSKKSKDPEEGNLQQVQQQRGRERISLSTNFSRKGTRSLSPMRVTDIIYEQEDDISPTAKIISSTTDNNNNNNSTKSYAATILSAISFSKSYKKWKFKDLLLFRSASEGRATGPDPLRKYSVLSKNINKEPDDVKNASFRSTDSAGSVSRRRGPVSAHELHYTANRAVSEELKRKTFLPYKQGLLGCLGFNPGVHNIPRGGSLPRG
ncbi:uncharacterized protein LOC123213534 [Mangifera indica]|uniref:uncharacterized protein LOC123213534 n=1 Tax=Mangifera indica TaxID=29780 RepID=UPI001CFC1FE8|nr:uncharacterized protein LOC123213534 [Mangifera indica]